jgi:hypothetical protein
VTTKRKPKDPNAPVFTARNYPPASFSLPTDGKKAQQRCRDRRNLYVQITTYGKRAFPSVKTLATAMGWSRAKTFRVLDDLKVLGCLLDAKDAKGRKYTGEHGSRVRSVDSDALPAPGSSRWLAVKDVLTSDGNPLLVRFVNRTGISNGENNSAQESQIEKQQSQIESRSLTYGETQKNLQKELPEKTTPTPKEERTEIGGGGFSEELGIDEEYAPPAEELAKQEQEYQDYIRRDERQITQMLLLMVKELPLPDGLRTGIKYQGIVELRKVINEEIPYKKRREYHDEILVNSWRVFLEQRDFAGLTKTTAWKLFADDFKTDWLPKGFNRWKASR